MVVDEGDGDGDGDREGVEVVDPPPCTPPPPLAPLASQSPQSATARKAGVIPWSAQVLEQGCAGDQPVFCSPAHSHMRVMWIFRRLFWCLIRQREEEHRGTWGKDASGGGVCVWKPLPGAPLAPMPESHSAGKIIVSPPRRPFRDAALPSVAAPLGLAGKVKQWRQGKAVVFGVDWATVLALPGPIYDPGCQPSYEGLIPNCRSVKAASVAVNVAKPAAQSAPMASAGAPIEAPTAASHFRDAMGAAQAAGISGTFQVWCLLASLNFEIASMNFSRFIVNF